MKLTTQNIPGSRQVRKPSSSRQSATTRIGVAATPSARPCPALRSLSSRIHLRILRLLPLHLHLRSPPHQLSLPPQHSRLHLHSHLLSHLPTPLHRHPLSPPLLHLPPPTRPRTLRPLRRQPPIHPQVSRQLSPPVTL